MWPNTKFPADLATSNEETLNGKLHLSCSECFCIFKWYTQHANKGWQKNDQIPWNSWETWEQVKNFKKNKIELKIHAAKGFFELKNNNNKIEN